MKVATSTTPTSPFGLDWDKKSEIGPENDSPKTTNLPSTDFTFSRTRSVRSRYDFISSVGYETGITSNLLFTCSRKGANNPVVPLSPGNKTSVVFTLFISLNARFTGAVCSGRFYAKIRRASMLTIGRRVPYPVDSAGYANFRISKQH